MGFLFVKILMISIALTFIAFGASIGSAVATTIGFGLGSAVGFYTVWRCMAAPQANWSICALHGGATLASYFGGALFTIITFGMAEIIQSGYTTHSGPELIFLASLLVALYSIILVAFGLYENRYWNREFENLPQVPPTRNTAIFLLVLLASIQAFYLLSGQVTVQGFKVGPGGEVPIVASLVSGLSMPILGVCGYVIGDKEKRYGMALFILCIVLVPIETAWAFSFGRRALLYSFVAFFGAFLWSRETKVISVRFLVLLVVVGVAMYYLSNFFVAIRLQAGLSHVDVQQKTLLQNFGGASALMDEGKREVLMAHFKNLQTRFFILGYLGDLIGGTRADSPLLGLAAVSAVVKVLPRLIFPWKVQFNQEIGSDEDLVNPQFGLQIFDAPGSVLVSAYADFLWLGVLIYPFIILGMGIVMSRLVRFARDRLMKVYIMAFGLIMFLAAEESLSAYLVGIRSLMILVVGMFLWRLFLSQRRTW